MRTEANTPASSHSPPLCISSQLHSSSQMFTDIQATKIHTPVWGQSPGRQDPALPGMAAGGHAHTLLASRQLGRSVARKAAGS